MSSHISDQPVCGACGDVAPYAWLGEPHHCVHNTVARMGRSSTAARADNFARCLEAAIADGECCRDYSMGMDAETFVAISAVAAEFPDPSIGAIAAAHEAFGRDIRGIHYNESHAVFLACRDGEIAQRTRPEPAPTERDGSPRPTYGAHSITIIEPDPAAAREWILANRANPSERYRRYVLNGSYPRRCQPPASYIVVN